MKRANDRTGARLPPEMIRFTAARAIDDRVELDGVGHGGEPRRFTIDAETVRALGGDDATTPLLRIYERTQPLIHAVATRTFNAGVRGDPIHLPRALFRTL